MRAFFILFLLSSFLWRQLRYYCTNNDLFLDFCFVSDFFFIFHFCFKSTLVVYIIHTVILIFRLVVVLNCSFLASFRSALRHFICSAHPQSRVNTNSFTWQMQYLTSETILTAMNVKMGVCVCVWWGYANSWLSRSTCQLQFASATIVIRAAVQ